MDLVKIRVERILQKLRCFTTASLEEVMERYLSAIFQDDEIFYGIYENPLTSKADPEAILVTDRGIHLIHPGQEVSFLNYYEIHSVQVHIDDGNKRMASELFLTCKDGKSWIIEVCGGDERGKEVFEFYRFIGRVIEDLKTKR